MTTWTDLIYKARAGRDRLGVSPERSSMGEGGAEARELGPVNSMGTEPRRADDLTADKPCRFLIRLKGTGQTGGYETYSISAAMPTAPLPIPEDYAERMERLLHDFLSDNSRTMP